VRRLIKLSCLHHARFHIVKQYFSFPCNRNTATHTIEQELLFVGQESGKLLAVRDIIQKVSVLQCVAYCPDFVRQYSDGSMVMIYRLV